LKLVALEEIDDFLRLHVLFFRTFLYHFLFFKTFLLLFLFFFWYLWDIFLQEFLLQLTLLFILIPLNFLIEFIENFKTLLDFIFGVDLVNLVPSHELILSQEHFTHDLEATI
jgi:hypothetical protein